MENRNERQALAVYTEQEKEYIEASRELIDEQELQEMLILLREMDLLHGTVLDVGVGAGQLLNMVFHEAKNITVDAIDIVPNFIATIRANSDHRLRAAVVGDFHALPFPSTEYSLVISNFALNYASDLPRVMREIDRVLLSGGHLIFSTVIANKPSDESRQLPGKLTAGQQQFDVFAYQYTAAQITQAIESAGLRSVALRTFKPAYYELDRSVVKDDVQVLTAVFVAQKQ